MGLEIVALDVALLEAAAGLEYRIAPRPWTRESFAEELTLGSFCRVALAEGAFAGFVIFRPLADAWSLMNLGVAPAQRRRGIGRRLVKAGLDHIAGCGGGEVTLEVRAGNAAARGLYEAFGFREIGRRKNYYPGPPAAEDALVMALNVENGTT